MDILWRLFRILTEPVLFTFISVNRRNNEVRAHDVTSLFRRFTDTNKHIRGTGFVKIWKTRHDVDLSVDMRTF